MRKLTEKEIEEVKELIANLLPCDESEITPAANLKDDVGMDSLDMVETVMGLEEKFDIQISDEEADKVVTFEQLIAAVEKKLS